MNAAAIRNRSSEDIYENLDDAGARVPSQERITVRIGRPRQADVHDLDTVRPPSPPAQEARATADARTSDAPEQSMRRLRVARPVSGAPTSIQEPVTEAMLRDPRRE
jgi:hypothetical protein